MRDYIASDVSAMTEILTEYSRYADMALCGWYAIHAPGAGTKRCCAPDMRYLSLGYEEKAPSRWIARMLLNLRAQYTVGTFL